MIKQLTTTFSGLPRAARWAILGLLGIISYFVVVEPVLELTNDLSVRADRLADGLRREAQLLSSESQEGQALTIVPANFGAPLHPTDKANRPEALQRLVNETLRKYGVRPDDTIEKQAPLRNALVAQIIGPNRTMMCYSVIVTFESTPDDAAGILADLEQSPNVAAVSKVDIRRVEARRSDEESDGSPRVRVTLTPEAWIVEANAKDRAGAAGGGGAD